jgi:preprotein translocase subunit SecG
MLTLILVLITIVCVLLIGVVLLQNSKGGGLAANFASAQIMGVRRTADVLERGTWILAGSLIFLCILSTAVVSNTAVAEKKSVIEDQMNTEQQGGGMPSIPNAGTPQQPADSGK